MSLHFPGSESDSSQRKWLILKHHSFFTPEETFDQRELTKEDVRSLQVIEAVTRETARLCGIDLGAPNSLLKGAGFTLRLSFVERIATNGQRNTMLKESHARALFSESLAVENTDSATSIKSVLTCGLCEADPTTTRREKERSWINLPALRTHQHRCHTGKLSILSDDVHRRAIRKGGLVRGHDDKKETWGIFSQRSEVTLLDGP